MKQQDIEKLENYFIKKNRNFAIDGISRNTMKNELLLSDGEVEKYLKKRMFYSIGESNRAFNQDK